MNIFMLYPLIDLLEIQMSDFQLNLKRLFDILLSSMVLLIGLPFL